MKATKKSEALILFSRLPIGAATRSCLERLLGRGAV